MTENLFLKEETVLNAPALEQLHALKLSVMATAWTEQQQQAWPAGWAVTPVACGAGWTPTTS